MKRALFLALCFAICTTASAREMMGSIEKINYDDFNLHIYTSCEAMGDVSIVVEGEKGIVILEPQSFYKSIEELDLYISGLGKPIEKVISNYHAGGLASYDSKKIVAVKPMVEFMKSEKAQGMMSHFDNIFQGAMDTRPVKIRRTIPTISTQKWAGVEFQFTAGSICDFPASSVNIGGKAFYTHFAPNMKHPSPMQLSSPESLDATLNSLLEAKESGCELFIGSHGSRASQEDASSLIEYLRRVKTLSQSAKNSDAFAQQLIIEYPTLDAAQNVRAIAKALYAGEEVCEQREAVRARVNDYFNMVSNLDMEIASGLWAQRDDVSIITPRGHFVGADSIMNDFLIKAFSQMSYRKLSSLSEVINIYGDMASVQLYWIFDTIDAQGVKHQTRGRESLIFSKIDGEWRLVHVHYSRMPQ